MALPAHSEVQAWAAANGARGDYDLRALYGFAAAYQRVPSNPAELYTWVSGIQTSYGAWAPAYFAYFTANGGYPPNQETWAAWLAGNGVTDYNHVPEPGVGYRGPQVPATTGGGTTVTGTDPLAQIKAFWNRNDQNKMIVVGAGVVGYMMVAGRRKFF